MKYLHLGLFFVFSHIALGALPTMDLSLYPNYEDTPNNEKSIDVVFFEKTTEGELTPTCRVPVADYPEILSADLPFSTYREQGKTGFDLEPCAPELSAKLSEQAEHFQLYPQVAVLPAVRAGAKATSEGLNAIKNGSAIGLIGGVNILSCGAVGYMTIDGIYKHHTRDLPKRSQSKKREEDLTQDEIDSFKYKVLNFFENFPTYGQVEAGGAMVVAPFLGAIHTYAIWPLTNGSLSSEIARRTATVSSMIMGVVCSVAGGLLGYFAVDNYEIENELKAEKEAFKKLEQESALALEVANQVSQEYLSELNDTKDSLERAQRVNARQQATLTNTQNNLEQAKRENAEQQAELEASRGVVNNLSNALRDAYRQSVEQKAQNSQGLGNSSNTDAKQGNHHPPVVEQKAQNNQELDNSSNTDAKQGNHHPPVVEQRAQSSQKLIDCHIERENLYCSKQRAQNSQGPK